MKKYNIKFCFKNIYLILFIICILFIFINFKKNKNSNILSYPEFINEKEVIIEGYDSDAMEPFITKDGMYLFYNSLNNGINTSLYYAKKENDTLFKFNGEIENVNGQEPHLDAVPSMDINNKFFFISTNSYPEVFENYKCGNFDIGRVNEITPVFGDFYIYKPGWLIMDAEINYDGNILYYVNAKFSGKPIPDEAVIGIAEKNEMFFRKINKSENVLKNINNSTYLVYAPSITSDGKELYFTRIKKGTYVTEICVSIKTDPDGIFSKPKKLNISGNTVEAPSVTLNGSRLYYHKKLKKDGKYHIFTMKRK